MNCVQVTAQTDLTTLADQPGNEWLKTTKLVVKPDQLIKRRGKAGLVGLNLDIAGVCSWIQERMGKTVTIGKITGELDTFIIEPFLPHPQEDEFYLCLFTERDGDVIMFHHQGGVDVGDVDAVAKRILVPATEILREADVTELVSGAPEWARADLARTVAGVYATFRDLHFAYLEVNPLVAVRTPTGAKFAVLDLAAKLDEAAHFEAGKHWGKIPFPAPFGQGRLSAEEEAVRDLDGKTGASLKLTVLNPAGRVWLMTAGGGASVIMSDTVADCGYGHELANYGEYSGAPSAQQTFEYASALIKLMTKEKHPDGKFLLIGGGIANFTDVAATFKGIIRALEAYAPVLLEHKVQVWVRRAGPNWQEGLRLMRDALVRLGFPPHVFGPETHMTSIIPMALGLPTPSTAANTFVPQLVAAPQGLAARAATPTPSPPPEEAKAGDSAPLAPIAPLSYAVGSLFTPHTRSIVYGLQVGAVQNMLDFDFICGREKPSVACLVYPFQPDHYVKLYWNNKEILLPCLQSLAAAIHRFPEVDAVVNFSSFRSAYETTMEVLACPTIRCVSIIAEGVPERRARELLHIAQERGVTLIGPATVGGIKPGCFRIGNAGGMLDNIVASRLYRPGSVAYVTRSGGMSNEMNNILSQTTDGVYEGVAIGGDRFPGSTFIDHLLRYEADPNAKMLLLLGEVGGVEEYAVCELLKQGKITKPIVAWCIGTVAKVFAHEVQFGHAGACAHSDLETAEAKNAALRAAGAVVPDSFDSIGVALNGVYAGLVRAGTIQPRREAPPPAIPVDYSWAAKLGLIRKSSAFISSISDERGAELCYAGKPISSIIGENMGVGGVIGLLWFKKELPPHFCRFLEMVLQLTADHGPAVSGAHNTIVAARAGKDLISSLCSGLLTIGPRFGGALDDAARLFSDASKRGLSAEDFMKEMRDKKQLISGIGHKLKSLEDPDMRVHLVKQFAREFVTRRPVFEFACEVEQLTTKKKSNLILNVDGAVAAVFVDLMTDCGLFSETEVDEYVSMGILNGLFVLGRTIGFVGHFIDQNRFKQPLYRHPHDDINYVDGF